MKNYFSKLLMELAGTFFLCYVGGWSCILYTELSTIAFTHTLVLASFIYLGANISGGQYNPALSITLLMNKLIDFKDFIFCVSGQILGSLLAGFLLKISLFEDMETSNLGFPAYSDDIAVSYTHLTLPTTPYV